MIAKCTIQGFLTLQNARKTPAAALAGELYRSPLRPAC
jgi:hypothetical protein